jgi:hypothetical protein
VEKYEKQWNEKKETVNKLNSEITQKEIRIAELKAKLGLR